MSWQVSSDGFGNRFNSPAERASYDAHRYTEALEEREREREAEKAEKAEKDESTDSGCCQIL